MLTAIGVAIALNIAANIVAATASPKNAGKKDERDEQINRFGEYVGFYVMSVGAVVPLGLAMAKVEHSGSPTRCTWRSFWPLSCRRS